MPDTEDCARQGSGRGKMFDRQRHREPGILHADLDGQRAAFTAVVAQLSGAVVAEQQADAIMQDDRQQDGAANLTELADIERGDDSDNEHDGADSEQRQLGLDLFYPVGEIMSQYQPECHRDYDDSQDADQHLAGGHIDGGIGDQQR